ncbi:MAG: hypothetical protein KAT15_28870, partial [Bacteroidales bacterium]|nr:hypothetical protein [Bacteroidales bacterium]
MRKITMWMVMMAIAVTPLMAQEVEPSDTEQQQIDQAIDEAIVEEAEEQAIEEAIVEEAEEQAIDES